MMAGWNVRAHGAFERPRPTRRPSGYCPGLISTALSRACISVQHGYRAELSQAGKERLRSPSPLSDFLLAHVHML